MKFHHVSTCLLLLVCVCVFAAGSELRAQPTISYERCLEYELANSDFVFVGKPKSVKEITVDGKRSQ